MAGLQVKKALVASLLVVDKVALLVMKVLVLVAMLLLFHQFQFDFVEITVSLIHVQSRRMREVVEQVVLPLCIAVVEELER